MELSFTLFATAAEFTPDGKLYLLGGGIEILHAPALPVGTSLACVVRLLVSPEECGRKHTFEAEFLSPSGQPIAPSQQIPFQPNPHPRYPDRKAYMAFAINLPGLLLLEAGEYTVRLAVDGVKIGEALFEVVLAEAATALSGAAQATGEVVR